MDSMPINPVDGLIVLAVLLSALLALFRGLVREVLSLISWTVAVYMGVRFNGVVKPFFGHYTDSDIVAASLGGFVIFVIVLIILTIASHFAAKTIRDSAVSSVDRALGFLFGALRGFLVAALVYLGGTLIFTNEKSYPNWLTDAKTEPALRHSAEWLVQQLPSEQRESYDRIRHSKKKDGEKTAADKTDAETKADDAATLDRLSAPQPGHVDGRLDKDTDLDNKPDAKTDKADPHH